MIGSAMIHSSKDEREHNWFILNLKHQGVEPEVIGTDAETAIANAIKTIYPSVTHIYCWKHFLDNVVRKLVALNISEKNRHKVKVIFTGHVDHKGLLESKDQQELDEQWNNVKKRIHPVTGTKTNEIVDYIEKWKIQQMKEGMILDVREKAGVKGA